MCSLYDLEDILKGKSLRVNILNMECQSCVIVVFRETHYFFTRHCIHFKQ